MSDKESHMLIAGALLFGAYIYSRRSAYPAQVAGKPAGAVGTMPGSAGSGWSQVGAAALTGFLQAAASGVRNNASPYGYVSSLYNGQQAGIDARQSGTVQDVADYSDTYGAWA